MKRDNEGDLSEELYLLVLDLKWVLDHQDPGLDLFQLNSLIHHLREVSMIIRRFESKRQKEEESTEFSGDRITALDSLQLLVQIGGSLVPSERKEIHHGPDSLSQVRQ